VAPALSLTAAFAVPAVEPMLAPLYIEPQREDLTVDIAGRPLRADVYRPTRAYAGVVLVYDAAHGGPEVESLARVLARRGVSVVVPKEPMDVASFAVDYARTSGVPVRIATAAAFRRDDEARSVATRAAYAWRLFHLVNGLLAPR
jgi:dienelactone hydrolase